MNLRITGRCHARQKRVETLERYTSVDASPRVCHFNVAAALSKRAILIDLEPMEHSLIED